MSNRRRIPRPRRPLQLAPGVFVLDPLAVLLDAAAGSPHCDCGHELEFVGAIDQEDEHAPRP